MPQVYLELLKILKKLEKHYKDMQDVEFTVENKNLLDSKHVLKKNFNQQLKLQLIWLKKINFKKRGY